MTVSLSARGCVKESRLDREHGQNSSPALQFSNLPPNTTSQRLNNCVLLLPCCPQQAKPSRSDAARRYKPALNSRQ